MALSERHGGSSTTSSQTRGLQLTVPMAADGVEEPRHGHIIDSNEVQAIRTDLAALRVAIDMVRAQYEERMAAIREAHESILRELESHGEQDEDAEELTDEVRKMEVKMEVLESQAGGLAAALDRYTELFMEEVTRSDQRALREGQAVNATELVDI